MCHGNFDVVHPGHVRHLTYAKTKAAILIVSITADEFIKKGISITPVKFGVSFTTTHLNQGGALVHIYTDGTVHLNHGGVEMGQGLMTKISQIAAHDFGIEINNIKITSTNTEKVPNTQSVFHGFCESIQKLEFSKMDR